MDSYAFGVFAGGLRLVASSRGRAFKTRVVAFISTSLAVMGVHGFGSGLVGCVATKLGIMIGELGYLLERCDELGLTGRELGGEGDVCCGESRNGSTITGHSCGKVGNGLDRVMMVDGGVGSLETGASSGDL